MLALLFGAFWLVSLVVGIARGGASPLYGDTLQVSLQLSRQDVGTLPPGIHLNGWPDVTVDVDDPTTEQMLLRAALDLGPLLLFVAALWLVRAFLRSVLDGDPFGAQNVLRLRSIGFLLVAGAPLVALVNSALRTALFDIVPPHPSLDLGSEGFSIPLGALVGGLGAYILADVFAYGRRLREDVEATI